MYYKYIDMKPLHLAAWNGHYDAVRLLLDLGADPYCHAKDGKPLHYAIVSEHANVCELLMEYEDNISAQYACLKDRARAKGAYSIVNVLTA